MPDHGEAPERREPREPLPLQGVLQVAEEHDGQQEQEDGAEDHAENMSLLPLEKTETD